MTSDKPIIFFDGVCNLCAASVQFILKHERQSLYLFGSLQAKESQKLLQGFNPLPDSILLLENGIVYTKSDAILRIAKQLKTPWNWLVIGHMVPKGMRDLIYDWVASHRYQWFGKKESCMLPSPAIQNRFIG